MMLINVILRGISHPNMHGLFMRHNKCYDVENMGYVKMYVVICVMGLELQDL